MLINRENLEAIFRAFNTIYQENFQNYKQTYLQIATALDSTTSQEDYSFLSAMPKMREWLGERQFKNLTGYKYPVFNKDWESTVPLNRNDIEDDKIGLFKPVVAEMARAAASHPDELIFDLLKSGFETPCYDGLPFFSPNHKVNKKTVSNMSAPASDPGNAWFLFDTSRAIKPLVFQQRKKPELIAAIDPKDMNVFLRKEFLYGVDTRDNAGFGLWQFAFGSTMPLTPENYAAARASMMAVCDNAGRKLQVIPNLLVVGGSNEGAARQITDGEFQAATGGMASNPWKGTAKTMVTPYLD
jgi:phage major head subunit gpT-like protein